MMDTQNFTCLLCRDNRKKELQVLISIDKDVFQICFRCACSLDTIGMHAKLSAIKKAGGFRTEKEAKKE